MSETANVGELESIAQAIALADGFQLLVLECEPLGPDGLQLLLLWAQNRVEELRGEWPTVVTIRGPHWLSNWMAGLVGPSSSRGAVGEAHVITVLDGTEVTASPTVRDDSNWHFLFQRLNEQRNALMRKHASTLILALTPALRRIFFEEAPDMASIRSGLFHIDAALLPAQPIRRDVALRLRTPGVRGDLGPELPRSAKHRLHALLLDLFQTSELLRFLHFNFPDVASTLPTSSSPSELALALVDQLESLGRIDRSLFERLARERPHRKDEIAEVASACGHALASPVMRGTKHGAPSDLHERLLALTPGQQEQVMYLAQFAGDDSASTTRALREHRSTSARELLARARSEGPEALARLADAIDVVTARD
jgi:hypothetical protein